jgi:hypothetical protein
MDSREALVIEMLLNLLSVLAAAATVGVAVWGIWRAAALASDANEISVVTGLLGEFRSAEVRRHVRVLENLGSGTPENGFSGLGEATESAYAVCYLFEYLGQLVALRNIPKDLVLSLMSTHLVSVWGTLEPYIIGERDRRERELPKGVSRRFLPHYEHLVGLVLERRGPDGSVPVADVVLHRLTGPLKDLLR